MARAVVQAYRQALASKSINLIILGEQYVLLFDYYGVLSSSILDNWVLFSNFLYKLVQVPIKGCLSSMFFY